MQSQFAKLTPTTNTRMIITMKNARNRKKKFSTQTLSSIQELVLLLDIILSLLLSLLVWKKGS